MPLRWSPFVSPGSVAAKGEGKLRLVISELAYLHYTACNIGNLVETGTETTYLLNIVLLQGPFRRHLRGTIPEPTAGKKNFKPNSGFER